MEKDSRREVTAYELQFRLQAQRFFPLRFLFTQLHKLLNKKTGDLYEEQDSESDNIRFVCNVRDMRRRFMSACSCNNRKSEVTVTFVTNGGKEIAPITLKKGEELNLPTAEKEGRVFADWYYDEGFASVCPKR